MNRPSSRSEVALEENQCLKDRLQDENLVLREQIDQAIMFESVLLPRCERCCLAYPR
jgi:dynactin complex subunit